RSMRSLIDQNTLEKLRDAGKPPPDGYREVRDKISTMLKDPDEALCLQAILTLCYFGDHELCWTEFKAALNSPHEHVRSEAYGALHHLPGKKMIEAVRICL